METKIINGMVMRQPILEEIKKETGIARKNGQKVPGIAFIAVIGDNPLMKYTIPMHVQLAEEMGFFVLLETRHAGVSEKELFDLIGILNKDERIHAIVLLQPLPSGLNSVRITGKIDPVKEVEGFHPENILGTLLPDVRQNRYPMCLPAALYELFLQGEVKICRDKEWVFVLDDEFFANSFTHMIARTASIKAVPKDCIVTMVNSESGKLAELVGRADFLVVITKKPEFIRAEWLKPGVCIIDIYSNLVKEVPSKDNPEKIVPVIRGGVNLNSVKGIAEMIIPVPGGLMPMALALTLRNALEAFRLSHNGHSGFREQS
jgi:methylenetetrahydrofolate dehydrogenase (NADP+) / methenyltetrahydrofolate cyclohydrolase